MKKALSYSIPPLFSTFIIVSLWNRVHWPEVAKVLSEVSAFETLIFCLLMAIILVINATRWARTCKPTKNFSLLESLRQVLLASSLDPIVPFKAGSFFKGIFLLDRGISKTEMSFRLIYEKLSDLFGVFFVFALVYLFLQQKQREFMPAFILSMLFLLFFCAIHLQKLREAILCSIKTAKNFNSKTLDKTIDLLETWNLYFRKLASTLVNTLSLLFWVAQAIQFIWFFNMLKLDAPISLTVAGTVGVFILGWVPFTFLGLGLREYGLLWIFGDYINAEQAIGIGVLFLIRSLLPSILGLLLLLNSHNEIRTRLKDIKTA